MNATSVGALLLCRAEPAVVRPAAHLLRERLLLAPAGEGWTVLVPEGKPWLHGDHPVDRVVVSWATALAVGSNWPVLALWWDAGRAGYTLAAGFRRTVGYVWLEDGTPAGEDEAMRTFAARLGLDPVLDLQALEPLTRQDPEADSRDRLRELAAFLTRTGLMLPAGLTPGEPADRLREVARIQPGGEQLEWAGWRDTVRAELDVVEDGPLGPWLRGPKARLLAAAQLTTGVPLVLWAARRRSAGWAFAGALLVTHGVLGLAYDRFRAQE
ncbi:hypothetical protein OIE62_28560 [Streptomyces scopuliridis]|uniref:Uncharacterized protein n=1 Tax=Streptomyces scopuliridis TaxID=452529 RepID=A0ACD4ZHG7_9ACTN|nr:hypothetical protein [Streptomyces scopuliridis]WSB33465.1 hypothetical protein OG949_11685 [Streptomyces scopuliridis]WSB97735.1 hypothetical protein OG835_12375 [Streptomyces scopuliridis]WSC08562.1 hypothetical protein OIE62_28560 [Streptomyces scopuliridis]